MDNTSAPGNVNSLPWPREANQRAVPMFTSILLVVSSFLCPEVVEVAAVEATTLEVAALNVSSFLFPKALEAAALAVVALEVVAVNVAAASRQWPSASSKHTWPRGATNIRACFWQAMTCAKVTSTATRRHVRVGYS